MDVFTITQLTREFVHNIVNDMNDEELLRWVQIGSDMGGMSGFDEFKEYLLEREDYELLARLKRLTE